MVLTGRDRSSFDRPRDEMETNSGGAGGGGARVCELAHSAQSLLLGICHFPPPGRAAMFPSAGAVLREPGKTRRDGGSS